MNDEKKRKRHATDCISKVTSGKVKCDCAEPDPVAARIAHLEGLLRAGDAALEALGVPNHGEPIAERIEMLGNERDMARGLNEANIAEQIRGERGELPSALTPAELAAHRVLDAKEMADDEPDPEPGWTRVEMRAACSPATRDFLAAMDRLRDGGGEAEGLEAFKTFLRAEREKS